MGKESDRLPQGPPRDAGMHRNERGRMVYDSKASRESAKEGERLAEAEDKKNDPNARSPFSPGDALSDHPDVKRAREAKEKAEEKEAEAPKAKTAKANVDEKVAISEAKAENQSK